MEDERLKPFVVMPEEQDIAFSKWWDLIPFDHFVAVRYPHERHGNARKTSHNAKTQVREDFQRFIDLNSKPNCRSSDSHSSTHYFLPKFTTIRMPSQGVTNYDEKMASSLVGEFNRLQRENERSVCSDGSAWNWLKQDRPKHVLYPHKSDYCDFCARKHEEIRRQQTTLNRIRQSGSAEVETQKRIEENIAELQELLKKHKQEAAKSLAQYQDMTSRCQSQWKDIMLLETKSERSTEDEAKLQELRDSFTLVLSADYQMGKLLPSWCKSPQPSSTYYYQKLSCDILGIVDHREGNAACYTFDERVGPKNSDHTISYILHYIKSENVPSCIKRVHLFMDNAGSTNKNMYIMGATMEVVHEDLFHFFRISFMVAGHTKFDPDRLFSNIARAFNQSDVLTLTSSLN